MGGRGLSGILFLDILEGSSGDADSGEIPVVDASVPLRSAQEDGGIHFLSAQDDREWFRTTVKGQDDRERFKMTVKGQDNRERFRTTVKGQNDRKRFRMTVKGQDDRERFKMTMTGQDDKKND